MADKSNEVDIKIRADASDASNAIGDLLGRLRRFGSSLSSVTGAVSGFIRAFSRLNWVVASIQTVIDLYNTLHEWLNRAATEAKELQDRLANESAATAAAHAAEAYKKLNKELAEANRLERERNAILDQRKSTERDLEDASAERDKQLEISKLDPNSATYAEDRAAIERRFAREAANRAESRAAEDAKEGAKRLYAEADQKDRDADAVQKNYERQMGVADRYREIRWRTAMEARNGDEEAQRKAEEADKRWQQEYDAAMKIKEAMESLRKEADSIRARAGEMAGGSLAGRIRNEAVQRRIDNEERDSAAKAEQAKKAEEERKAKRDADEKRRAAELEARERVRAENAERSRLAGTLGSMADAAASFDGVSQNRLTAMGLGSGVSATGGVAGDVRKIVDLLKQEIEATKNIKSGESGEARYTED